MDEQNWELQNWHNKCKTNISNAKHLVTTIEKITNEAKDI
jgi:hypothetical protein